MTEHIAHNIENGVLTLAFNRPDKKNAITRDMYAALADAFEAANGDASVKVAIITGEGDMFTAGNDLMDFMAHPPTLDSGETPPVFRFMKALFEFEKPVIAAVNGPAIGIGVTLLLHCDLAYAAKGSVFQTPFANLALSPEFGSSLMMSRVVGHTRAYELLVLGEKIDADKAERLGLVNDVVAPEVLAGHARATAERLAAMAPASLKTSKALMHDDKEAVGAFIEKEGRVFVERLQSDEFKEAVAAFLEKRAPDFSKFV